MITASYALTATERVLPRLALDFTTGSLDARVTVTRALNTATCVNSSGYIQTVNSNLPRFDYSPVTLNPKGLLIEESRANLFTYSNDISNAIWSKIGLLPITSSTEISPSGLTDVNALIEDTSNGGHLFYQAPTTTAAAHGFSLYAKPAGRNWILLINLTTGDYSYFNIATGAKGFATGTSNPDITPVGNGWYRCSITGTCTAAANLFAVYLASANGVNTYQGNGTSGIYFYGAQVELGAFPTSYIPTTSTSLTRNADAVSMTGTNFSSWYNQSEGAIVCSVSGGKNSVWAVSYDMGTTGNLAYVRQTSPTAVSSVINGAGSSAASITADAAYTTALAYKNNDCAFAINGGQLSTFAGTPGTATDLIIGSLNGSFVLNGHVKKLMFYPQRLTNAECVAFSK